MRTLLASLAALTLLLAARPALACSVCAAGDPLVAAGDAAPEARSLKVSLETEWLTASAAMDDADMPGMVEDLDQTTVRALAVFSPLHRVNVALGIPFVRKSVSETAPGMDHGTETFSGLGDVELGARLFLLDRTNFSAMRHQSLALSAGTSLPTGENDARDDLGLLLDEHSQLGTGAYGPYVGVLYRLEQSRWHAFASLSGRFRTENARGYRYGAALAGTVQAQRQLRDRLAVGLGVDGREAARDERDGAAVAHTGGLVLAAAPSVHVGLGGPLWLSLRAQIPFATRLHGEQDVGPTVSAALQLQVF
jgi:hypothetical protein